MNSLEHTDPDGDALTITRDKGLAWITITRDGDELTVGPIPGNVLDDTDGGVTAALIEQEAAAGVCCGPLDESARFWHDRWHEAADQRDTRDLAAHLWKEAARRAVNNHRSASLHRDMVLAALDSSIRSREEAEKERDEARATKDMHKRRADEERARADAAGPRPLTAREHLDAARDARDTGYPLPKGATIPEGVPFWVKPDGKPWQFVISGPDADFDTAPHRTAQYVLVDPPTPTRPDGAKAIEAALRDEWTFEDDDEFPDLADRLASRGVRVEGSGR